MDLLVYFGIGVVFVTLVGALFLAPVCSLGYRPLLSGYTVIIYTMILYIFLSALIPIFLNNMTSLFFPAYSGTKIIFGTLVVNWIGILLFVGFYQFFTRRRNVLFAMGSRSSERGNFPVFAYGLISLGLAMKFLYVQRVGGLHEILVMRSARIAESVGIVNQVDGITLYLLFFSMMADASACWLLLEATRVRKNIYLHIFLCLSVLIMTFLVTPKRHVLIVPIFALIAGFGVYIRPLRLKHAPLFLVGAVTFSMITIAGRVFLPAYAAGITILNLARIDLVRKFAIRMLSGDIAFFDASAVGIYGREQILAKFDGWWDAFYRPNIEPLFYAVPRAIWPWKPDSFVDVSTALIAVEHGVRLENSTGGFGIGIIGTSWVYGEFAGLVCGMALLAWSAAMVDRFLTKVHYASPGRIIVFAISATTLFHLYRQGSLGWVFLNFFQTMAVFWLCALFLTYRASSRKRCSVNFAV